MKRWYLAHTRPKAEQRAVVHLMHQGMGVYLPRYLVQRSHARRRDWVEKPLFPGYLFLHLDLERDYWRAVRSTVGIRNLVSAGDQPIAVDEEIIREIKAAEDEQGFVSPSRGRTFHSGDCVRIVEGPFLDAAGIFECQSDEERIIVLLDLLGRQVKVTVPLRAVV